MFRLRCGRHLILYRIIHRDSSRRVAGRRILRGPPPDARSDQSVRASVRWGALDGALVCSSCFESAADGGCRAERSATEVGLWMSSSQSLTTLDMRGFHSLLAAWWVERAVLRRWVVAVSCGEGHVHWATGPVMHPWRGIVLRVGHPCGTGRTARARVGIPARNDTGDRGGSGERRGWAVEGRRQDPWLRRVWTNG